ncbi:MAG: MFS transporter [Opitutaceae bacterium]|jgi:OPA family sugar phosphate sensor protein UhpC-like MFS transporter
MTLFRTFVRFFAAGKDKPPLDDQGQVDRLYRRHRLLVILAITLGYGIAYTCRLGLSVAKKPLIDANLFSADDLGKIGSMLLVAYAVGKLVNGFLADHANVKRFLTAGILLSALVNLFMGWSPFLWVWIVLWGFNGWFQSIGAPAGVVSLSQWFSNKERGRYYGIWSTAHPLGEGLTFVASSALVSYFGWRASFAFPGIVTIGVAVAVYFMVQDRPRTMGLPSVADWKNDRSTSSQAKAAPAMSTWQTQLTILKLPSIWILALASATMYMTRYAMSGWGMLYLQEEKGYSILQAGSLIALYPLAGLAGCVSYGFVSDKLFQARRPPVNLACAILEITALGFLFFSPPGHPVLLAGAFLAYGFSLSGLLTSLGGLFAVDIAPKRAAGAVMGFVGVFSYVGAALQERISGILIQNGTSLVGGVRHYDFHRVVLFWMGTSVVSMILAASLWRAKATD